MKPSFWEIRVRKRDPDKNMKFIGEVNINDLLVLEVELLFNEPAKWKIQVDARTPSAEVLYEILQDTTGRGLNGIMLSRNGRVILTGPYIEAAERMDPETGKVLEVSGHDDLYLIKKHLALPHPKYFASPYMHSGLYEGVTDPSGHGHTDYYPNWNENTSQHASSHIHNFVWDNIGEGQENSDRRLGFLVTRDNGVGYVIPGDEKTATRGENLWRLCKGVADYSDYKGYPIRMRCLMGTLNSSVAPPVTGILFECLASEDKPNVIFSPDLGNVVGYTYRQTAPTATRILMGGSGQGRERKFAYAADDPAEEKYGVTEAFRSYTGARPNDGQSTDWDKEKKMLTKEIYSELAKEAEKTVFDFKFQETEATQYGRDFNIGDRVSVKLGPFSTTDVIRRISIRVRGNEESIDIVVGKQGAISKGLRLFDQLDNLEYRYNGLTKNTLGQ